MRALLDLIFPPLCPCCQTVVSQKSTVCPECWQQLTFISDPFCCQCGLPLALAVEEEGNTGLKCGGCLASPPAFSAARSLYVYDALSKKMMVSFKHSGKLYLAPFFAQNLWNVGKDLLETSDLIMPVPLHWRRLYKRGFNQSALLAQKLGKLSKKPVDLSTLKRLENTPPQGDLSLEDRLKNVASCFKVTNANKVKGKSIVVVDDVMTTGATLNACAKVLLKAGAQTVTVLSVARVATPS